MFWVVLMMVGLFLRSPLSTNPIDAGFGSSPSISLSCIVMVGSAWRLSLMISRLSHSIW